MTSRLEVHQALTARYQEIVSLEELRLMASENTKLAGLFVSSVSDEYLSSHRRVMIVGKETRSWSGGLGRVHDFPNINAYLQHAMDGHASYLRKPQPTSKFFQFYREVSRQMVGDKHAVLPRSVAWANMFCLSYEGKSPVRAKDQFQKIETLSRDLLRAQIEILKPDVILFVTGPGYDKYLKKFFHISNGSVIHKKSLWSFSADKTPAFRTTHPQWEKGKTHRSEALALALALNLSAITTSAPDAVQAI